MPEQKYRIGVDLGGTFIQVGVVDAEHRLIGKKEEKTRPHERAWREVCADIAMLINRLLAEMDIPLAQCSKLGIGTPGQLDRETGTVLFAGNLAWENVPLLDEMRRYYNIPIKMGNDADCAVLGEAFAGAAKGTKNVLMITLGTGVGGGVIVDGKLCQGGASQGMEVGHTLLMMNGEECTCGRKGCLEAYGSAGALSRQAQAAAAAHPESVMNTISGGNLSDINAITPFQASRMDDPVAVEVVNNYIAYVGEGIVNFVNIWRPEKVLIGGGVSNEGPPLIIPLAKYVRARCFGGERDVVPTIERAVLGNDAGVIGAAAL